MVKLSSIIENPISGEWGLEDLNKTGLPVLRTTNFTNEGIINYNNITTRIFFKKNIKEKFLKYGDILLEKSGGSNNQPVGRVVFFDKEDDKYLFNNFISILRIKNKEEYISKYIFYLLHYNYINGGTIKFQNKTTGLHNLQVKSFINAFQVEAISINKQCKIIKILDIIYNLIRLKKLQLSKLDQLVKSRFIEMFGDPTLNIKMWNIYTLGERCQIITGNTPSRAEKDNYGDFIEWIKSNNITKNEMYISKAEEFLSLKGFSKGRYVESGSLLMTCIAGSINCIGNVAISDRRVAFNQQINAIIPKVDNKFYIYWLIRLSQKNIHTVINKSLKGILNKSQLSAIKFPFPPIPLQEQFAAFVQQVDKAKSSVKQSLEKLETLKKSLMQEYFG